MKNNQKKIGQKNKRNSSKDEHSQTSKQKHRKNNSEKSFKPKDEHSQVNKQKHRKNSFEKNFKQTPVSKTVQEKPEIEFIEEKVLFDGFSRPTLLEEINLNQNIQEVQKPEILAPAGDMSSFLAALAAGADACYVGLKHFSARAGADNFSTTELSRMVNLAGEHDKKVNIAFNSLVKPNEMATAGRLMKRLARDVKPNAIIVQDLGLVEIARQAGFEGELHLSTLANLTHPKALEIAAKLGAKRVILPREINIDEIHQIAKSCPTEIDLELFVHGALCYCVSGRCYWSSYMGGKSGLRGRCVQPCRRIYSQRSNQGRYFSSQDLSLDVLVKSLLPISKINCWKIEGRKKGPHYVYHTVMAYKILRDEGNHGRKEAEALLEMALGRPSTHGTFLPQNPIHITIPNENTGSGLLVGKIQFDLVEEEKSSKKTDKKTKKNEQKSRPNLSPPYFKPRIPLLNRDLIRIGFEDDTWYNVLPITRQVPKAGSYTLKLERSKTPKSGTPVYLIDRREPELIKELNSWEKKLNASKATQASPVEFTPNLPRPIGKRNHLNIRLRASLPQGKETRAARSSLTGLWLSPSTVRAVSKTLAPRISWWLPPVIWTNEEHVWQRTINEAINSGSTQFVCNEPWQIAFFMNNSIFKAQYEQLFLPNEEQDIKKHVPNNQSHKIKVPRGGKSNQTDRQFNLIAGPFCNISNAASISILKNLGFNAAIVSPELSKQDYLLLPKQSCLPLGFIIEGFFPMGLSRHEPQYLKHNMTFTSPKKEQFWTRKYGQNTWIYPSWPMDFKDHRAELEHAGYSFFAVMEEYCKEEQERDASEFNWENPLL